MMRVCVLASGGLVVVMVMSISPSSSVLVYQEINIDLGLDGKPPIDDSMNASILLYQQYWGM